MPMSCSGGLFRYKLCVYTRHPSHETWAAFAVVLPVNKTPPPTFRPVGSGPDPPIEWARTALPNLAFDLQVNPVTRSFVKLLSFLV